MADRFWVPGGSGTWTGSDTSNWSATSGGSSGASVPTQSDNVYFDANSGSGTATLQTSTGNCLNLDFTGFTGTFAGTTNIVIVGGLTVSAAMTWTLATTLFLRAPSGTFNITTNGKSMPCSFNIGISTATSEYVLADALTCTNTITVTACTFTTNDYAVTALSLSSSNSNTRTINLGSSTVTLSSNNGFVFSTNTNLTFNAGTSTIVFTSTQVTVASGLVGGAGLAFYNVSFTSTASLTHTIPAANSFNDLTITGASSAGLRQVTFASDQTVNGTLTLSAGTNATCRTFVRSNTIGETRTLTCAAVASLTDIDFRDITIAGAAAPVSGTRLGDCKGNSGITFDAAKTVYYRFASSGNWGLATGWAATDGGTADVDQFPLAQDTAVIGATYPSSGSTVTINAAYNIGTIDMSARTSNTMTLACALSPIIYGNWINGTGTTLSGTGLLTFAGRGSQTITSAGKTFTQDFTIDTPGGAVTLQDAFSCSRQLTLNNGSFDANGYNVTLTGTGASVGVLSSNTNTRTFAIGSGTWAIASTSGWGTSTSTNLTVTGTGTISLTSASAKTFAGGGIQTYPTLNQGGTGALTITGSNKFADITNTAIGRVQFTGGTTNEFTAFNLNGVSGNLLQVGSTNTTQVTLKAPSWNVGANSTDAGNNTGLTFSAGSVDYLSISYVNGEITVAPTSSIYYGAANITAIYYGSTPVSAIYYGATQVF